MFAPARRCAGRASCSAGTISSMRNGGSSSRSSPIDAGLSISKRQAGAQRGRRADRRGRAVAGSEPSGEAIMMHDIVFLFDVDNTLLDNDRVQADLRRHLASSYGAAARDRYWADLRGAAQRARLCRLSRRAAALSARGPARPAPAADVELAGRLSVRRPALSRCARRGEARAASGAARSSCPTATSCFSRARSSAPGLWKRVRRTGC